LAAGLEITICDFQFSNQHDGAFDPFHGNQARVGSGHGTPIGLPDDVTGFRLARSRWLARNIAGDPGGDKRGCPTREGRKSPPRELEVPNWRLNGKGRVGSSTGGC
jgi:hypothetical protein